MPAYKKPIKRNPRHTSASHGHRRIGVRLFLKGPFFRANGATHPSPGHRPGSPVRKCHQRLKVRSIMRHAGTSTLTHGARMIGRAVGAEYHFGFISWGDAPGWAWVGALPLKSHGAGLLMKSRLSALPLKSGVWSLRLTRYACDFSLINRI